MSKKRTVLHIRTTSEDEKILDALTETTGLPKSDLVRYAIRRFAVSEGVIPPREHYEYGEPEKPEEVAMFLKRVESTLASLSVDVGRALHRLEREKD